MSGLFDEPKEVYELVHTKQFRVLCRVETTESSAERCNDAYKRNHCPDLLWRKSSGELPKTRKYVVKK